MAIVVLDITIKLVTNMWFLLLYLFMPAASNKESLAGYMFKGTAKNKAPNIMNFPIVTAGIGIEEITTASISNLSMFCTNRK